MPNSSNSAAQQKHKTPAQHQSNSHPETTKHVKPGVADERSSKAFEKGHDARTGQDKDGNEEQAKHAGKRG